MEFRWMGKAKIEIFASTSWEITISTIGNARTVSSGPDSFSGCTRDTARHLWNNEIRLRKAGKCIICLEEKWEFLVSADLLTSMLWIIQWAPRDSAAPISHATFSCDSQLVYASFLDGTVCIFTAAHLRLRCRINPSSYLPSSVRQVFFSWYINLELFFLGFHSEYQKLGSLLSEFWYKIVWDFRNLVKLSLFFYPNSFLTLLVIFLLQFERAPSRDRCTSTRGKSVCIRPIGWFCSRFWATRIGRQMGGPTTGRKRVSEQRTNHAFGPRSSSKVIGSASDEIRHGGNVAFCTLAGKKEQITFTW